MASPSAMTAVLETERLRLRPFQAGDEEAAHGWFADPDVMKHTPSGPDASLERTRERLANYERHQTKHGFSKWLVTERATGRPIGDAGLLALPEQGWTDLGFRFGRTFWGRGFGTEAASAWVTAAFGALGLDELGAFAHPDNTASLRILEKLGFARVRADVVLGMSSIVFRLRRREARLG